MKSHLNRRALISAGLMNKGSVKNAQKAKLLLLRHLPVYSCAGLQGAMYLSTSEVPPV